MNKKPVALGLSALIPKKEKKAPPKFHRENDAVFYIEIDKIRSNPYQPRKEFNFEMLKSLSQSIADYGVLQPLVVSKLDSHDDFGQRSDFQLIAGERRLIASKMAGLKEVPVIVRDATSQEKLELSIIENVQREDLNPIEKALAYKQLEREFNLSQKEIARICAKSRVAITNTLRLLKLPDDIQQSIREGKITEGHAKAILMVNDPEKYNNAYNKIVNNNLSVRDAESLAQEINEPIRVSKIPAIMTNTFIKFEDTLRDWFKVSNLKLRSASGKPKLVISFDSKKEFEEFMNRFEA
jgi:ParB family chromosome partitioning protein